VTYPREVPVEPGMPEGWKGIEKQYGPTSKYAGKVYCRYFSLDDRHRSVNSPTAVIKIHCEETGEDPAPRIAEYHRLLKEREAKRAEERRLDREARGKVEGEKREEAIARFRDRFGQLSGPVVFQFPNWVTRWHYQPNCDQVMVEYIDTDGISWRLLKDLECAFQIKCENGQGDYLADLISKAKMAAEENPSQFSEGAKKARETGGVYEATPGATNNKVISQEERKRMQAERDRAWKAQQQEGTLVTKRQRLAQQIGMKTEGFPQDGWAALGSRADIDAAFVHFHRSLLERGFDSRAVELVAIDGVSTERVYWQRIRGVYYRLPEVLDGQHWYQKLLHSPKAVHQVGCDGIYIAWSKLHRRWEVTTKVSVDKYADKYRPVVAHSANLPAPDPDSAENCEIPPLPQAPGPWQVQDGHGDYKEDPGLTVILHHVADGKQGEA